MRHPRQVLTRAAIFERVWGYDFGSALELARRLHRLPAPQDRGGRRAAADPHGARRRLRAARTPMSFRAPPRRCVAAAAVALAVVRRRRRRLRRRRGQLDGQVDDSLRPRAGGRASPVARRGSRRRARPIASRATLAGAGRLHRRLVTRRRLGQPRRVRASTTAAAGHAQALAAAAAGGDAVLQRRDGRRRRTCAC